MPMQLSVVPDSNDDLLIFNLTAEKVYYRLFDSQYLNL